MINWDSMIKSCGDEDIAIEVVGMFVKDSPRCIESIAEALQAQDMKLVKMYAHSLKGAAFHVGDNELAQKAYLLECAGRDKRFEESVSLFEQIQQEYDKLISVLSRPDWIKLVKEHQTADLSS